jgi:hypothetical protein
VIMVEFYAAVAFPGNSTDAAINFWLFDNGSSIGRLGHLSVVAAKFQFSSVYVARRLTPSAASHTYSIRASGTSGAAAGVQAGSGGVGGDMPTFIRITRA